MMAAPLPLGHNLQNRQVVYIVEDDELLRLSLVDLLQSHDISVEAFEDARAFYARPNKAVAGCMLADVQLPHLSGIELRAKLFSEGIDLPVIFMTAHGDVATSVRAMKTGALDFLQKPIKARELIKAIEAAFALDHKQQERRALRSIVHERALRLTPREVQVFNHVVEGLMNKQVAFEMGISEIMVKLHRGSMMRKMQVRSFADLVRCHALLQYGVSQSPH